MEKLRKNVKKVTAGGMEGEWDPRKRTLSAKLPVGVTEIWLAIEGIDGVHKMEFSSFDCAGSFIPWKDYDYPALSKGYMLYSENQKQRRKPFHIHSQNYPWVSNITCFENPTRPPFLKGGQRPMRGRSYSPSELRYQPRRRRATISLSPPRHTPTPSVSHSRSSSPSLLPSQQASMGVNMKRKRDALQDSGVSSPAPMGQVLENLTLSMAAAPSRTITTSGPLLNDIRLGPEPTPPLSPTRNKILDLPLPEDGVDPLGHPGIRRELSLADFAFIGILSTWIDSKEELESLAISLRWDLHRVDRALRVIPEFDKVRRLLLFEWFSKQMLSSSIPKLRRAFVAQGKGQWIDGMIKFKWYTDGKDAEIKPTRSPPCQTRFLYDITEVVNRGYDDAYLDSLASDLELDTGTTLAIHSFFPHIFPAVVFYTLEDWC